MKNLICFLAIFLFAIIDVFSQSKTTTINPLSTGVTAPVIDGDSSDVCWSTAKRIPLDVIYQKAPESFSASIKFTYDANYFYVLAIVNDASPHWEMNSSWENDCIELFFQMDTISDVNGKYGWGSWHLRKQRHKDIDPFTNFGNDYGFDGSMGDLEHSQTHVNFMKSFYNKGFEIKELDNGSVYVQEWKIPWKVLAINQRANTVPVGIGDSLNINGFDGFNFRFDAQASNNTDGNIRAGQIFYNNSNDNSWIDTRAMGFIKLSENVYTLPEQLKSYDLTSEGSMLILSGSQENVNYSLMNIEGTFLGSSAMGNGNPLTWKNLSENTYYCVANNSNSMTLISRSCDVTATNVLLNKLPKGISPKIDGSVESLWDTIKTHKILRNFVNEEPTISEAYWKATWNDTALFVMVSVKDDQHCDQWCSGAEEWTSDKLEIFMDVNSVLKDGIGPSTSNSGHYQYAPAFTQGASEYYYTGSYWAGGNLTYSYKLSGANYVYEYSIPWSNLKDKNGKLFNPLGSEIGFDVVIIDRDSVKEYRKRLVWRNTGGIDGSSENWFNMDESGIVSFPAKALTPEENYPTNAALAQLPVGVVPAIDGKKDPMWDTVAVHNIKRKFFNEEPSLDTTYWKAVWNDTSVFVFVYVQDDFHCDEWCSGDNNWTSDKAEIYFDMNPILKDGQGTSVPSNGHYQFAPGFTKDSIHYYYLDPLSKYSYSYKINGSDYIYEFSIPWDVLKDKAGTVFNTNSDNLMGFDVCIIDRDSANESRKRAVWSNTGGNDGNKENYFNMDGSGTLFMTYTKPTLKVTSDAGKIANGSKIDFGLFKTDIEKTITFNIVNFGQNKLNIFSINSKGPGFTLVQPGTLSIKPLDTLTVSIIYDAKQSSIDTIEIASNDPVNGTFKFYIKTKAVDGTIVPGGSVAGVWTKNKSPYFITGDITVPFDSTLTIEHGVYIEFEGYYGLNVIGKILANGIFNDSITFTSNLVYSREIEDLTTTKGGWRGIKWDNPESGWVMNKSDSSILKYCILKFSKEIAGDGGAVNANYFNKLKFYNCTFYKNISRNRGGAIFLSEITDIKIDSCKFVSNTADYGGAIALSNGMGHFTPIINSCSFQNNTATYLGGAVYLSCVKNGLSIKNSSFQNNHANSGGALFNDNGSTPISILSCDFTYNSSEADGGGIFLNFGGISIQNCLIANNSCRNRGGGLFINTALNTLIANNIIANNEGLSEGGGICFVESSPFIVNNTIVNNYGGNSGGLYFYMFNTVNFSNNIIWGNVNSSATSSQITFSTAAGTSVFKSCIIEPGNILMSNADNAHFLDTLCSNPYFINPTSGAGVSSDASKANWRIKSKIDSVSIAINRGVTEETKTIHPFDFYNKPRVLNGISDIGAAEAYIGKVILKDTIKSNTIVMADTAIVTGNVFVPDNITLTISPGTRVVFYGYYNFNVRGTIISKSTSAKPIVYTISDTTGFSNLSTTSGGWKYFDFSNDEWGGNGCMNDNDTSLFQYCIFEYSKFIGSYPSGGCINICYFSRIIISDCVFRKNIGTSGGALHITNQSSPLIKNNLFYNNSAPEGGAISCYKGSKPLILNNTFINNKAIGGLGSGGGLFSKGASPIIIGNIISNNSAAGNYGNGFGGGLCFSYFSKPVLINNTVVGNSASVSGGGMQCWDIPFNVYNTVFWINKSPVGNEVSTDLNGANFYNCNIINFKSEGNFKGVFHDSANVISSDPTFIKMFSPSGIYKVENSITQMLNPENYCSNISTFSGNIDKGTTNFRETGIILPLKDIFGNPRVNNKIIDIGASENQGSKISFNQHPIGKVLCEGESITLSVTASDTAKYQWQKDGLNISDANSASYTINQLKESDEGNYICIINNSYGKVYSSPAFLKIKTAPEIVENLKGSLIQNETTVNLQIKVEGSKPFVYKWTKDETSLSDTTNSLQLDSFSISDEGIYKCQVTNSCGSVSSKPAELYVAPFICLVTVTSVSPTEAYNTIIWGKESKITYAKYAVYRESSVAGYYDKIGVVNGTDKGEFFDKSVNPKEQAFLYKITGIRGDGSETDIKLCPVHKTIHLLVTASIDKHVQLDWDQYIGFPYSSYYIYRSTDGIHFDSIHAVSTSSRTWTDLDYQVGESTIVYYYISVKKAEPCYLKKAGGDIFDQSTSDIEDNRLKGSEGIKNMLQTNLSFKAYPNPFNINTKISYNLKYTANTMLELYDHLGKLKVIIANGTQQAGYHEYILATETLSPGVYTLRLKASNNVSLLKLVVMK